MPCTKDAASQTISEIDKPGGPVVSGPNSAANPGSISDTPHALGSAAEKEVELEASEKPDPCFLVVILSGFNVTSQSDDAVSLTASNLTSPNNINSSFRSPGKSLHSCYIFIFLATLQWGFSVLIWFRGCYETTKLANMHMLSFFVCVCYYSKLSHRLAQAAQNLWMT